VEWPAVVACRTYLGAGKSGAAETRRLQRLQMPLCALVALRVKGLVRKPPEVARGLDFTVETAQLTASEQSGCSIEHYGWTFGGWRSLRELATIWVVNQESLERANAFLAAVASRIEVGGTLDATPTDIGRQIGIAQPLASARAVRALLARRRLELVDGAYRLLDAKPVEADERESVPRKPRAKRAKSHPRAERAERGSSRPTYSQLGREAVEKLIELGRENATLRTSLRAAREEARDAREAKDDAERRAQGMSSRVRDLEARAEMAESNLRTLLAAAKGTGRDAPVGQNEMEAILGVLKGGEDNGSSREDERADASASPDVAADLSSDVGR
jgi:hypothetical protein